MNKAGGSRNVRMFSLLVYVEAGTKDSSPGSGEGGRDGGSEERRKDTMLFPQKSQDLGSTRTGRRPMP